jgi:N-glycosylase/DNA lyase
MKSNAARSAPRIIPVDSRTVAADGGGLDPDVTFDCGQCFRWEKAADGAWEGVAFGRELRVRRRDKLLLFEGTDAEEFARLWAPYFDLGRDYAALLASYESDPVLRLAVRFAPGLRILRQEPWEALCSFILSQNNNIPRIRGIIARLCEAFGERLPGGRHAFPGAERLAGLSAADLAPLRCGFRAKYILDAARKVASGEVELGVLSSTPVAQARESLQSILGVGPKVAECALLFGCGRLECFPQDVWIKRALACFYPSGFPARFAASAGVAQQILFHYARVCPACPLNTRREKGPPVGSAACAARG